MANKIFYYETVINPSQIDSFGHVNNACYLSILEDARWDLMIKGGYDLNMIKRTGLGPTILAINITFSKELFLNDKITVVTQITSYRKKIGIIEQEIHRDGVVCCHASITSGLFDTKARKLVLPSPEWLQAVGVE